MGIEKRKKTYHNLGSFLSKNHLDRTSTPEIEEYWNFIYSKRKQRGWLSSEKYRGLEKHHIVPVSFGGSNNVTNYVNLTSDEHIYAHILFSKVIKSSEKFSLNMYNKTKGTIPKTRILLKGWMMKKTPLLTYHP